MEKARFFFLYQGLTTIFKNAINSNSIKIRRKNSFQEFFKGGFTPFTPDKRATLDPTSSNYKIPFFKILLACRFSKSNKIKK